MQAKSFQPYSDDDFKQLFDKIDKATAKGDYQAINQYRTTLKMYWDTKLTGLSLERIYQIKSN